MRLETYPIMIAGALCGKLTVETRGARTVFEAECQPREGLVRISVYGGGREGFLGLMMPKEGKLRLKRTLTRTEMRDFPDPIEFSGLSGLPEGGAADAPASEPCGNSSEDRQAADGAEPYIKREGEGEKKGKAVTPPGPDCIFFPPVPSSGVPEAPAPETAEQPSRDEAEAAESPCPVAAEVAESPCPAAAEAAESPCPAEAEEPEGQGSGVSSKDEPADRVSPETESVDCAPPEAEPADRVSPSPEPETLDWYYSPDGALVCFDGTGTRIALPAGDERIPKDVPGERRIIEGTEYLVFRSRNGRIVRGAAEGEKAN